LTDELHNFHIHQGKFRLATGQDPGAPAELLTHAPIYGACGDWTGIPGIKPDCGTPLGGPPTVATNTIQAWHDTFPVPPRVDDTHPGRVFVWVPFAAREQVGDFVYHCHILEHEDGGMMAHLQVVDPAHPTLRAALDGAMCRTGL
jgi:FtsP/CotA-like multicopper oxidase with cupredoxin domain